LANSPVLLVHGGAWAIPDELVEAHLAGIRCALAAGWSVLQHGGPAIDAVESAVLVMEDDDAFDAGRGSFLNRDGKVQLDAMIMDGRSLAAGAVGAVERIRNPISLARKILSQSEHVYFAGEHAELFALEHGVSLIDNSELVIPRELERFNRSRQEVGKHNPQELFTGHAGAGDTVGAVALDVNGNLSAGTSTGGNPTKVPGRIGDASLIGCGGYADNQSAAVSMTGWGEAIMKLVLGKWACDRVADGDSPERASIAAVAYLKQRLDAHGGLILLDTIGRYGIAHNTPRMAWGLQTRDKTLCGIQKP